MKPHTATRDIDVYDPGAELRQRYPQWTLHTGLPGAQGGSWVSFQPTLHHIVINPDLGADERLFAEAFALALLDMGAVSPGKVNITPAEECDAQDLAELYLGMPPLFDPSVNTAA